MFSNARKNDLSLAHFSMRLNELIPIFDKFDFYRVFLQILSRFVGRTLTSRPRSDSKICVKDLKSMFCEYRGRIVNAHIYDDFR